MTSPLASPPPMPPHATVPTDPAGPWTSDRGDGTYRNPVLYADYSDPDAIRVGEDYWLTASSFGHVPGLPILHSRDLINWTLVAHALPALLPREHFAQPRHGQGVWAPAIRFHAGRFWIFYPDPDFGLFFVTATDPRGAWSTPTLVIAGRGLIDPCPLWDDNGQLYLIHGWAKSRAGICNLLTLHRLSPDATQVLDAGTVIIDANQLPGWRTLEGPKLYRRGEWYYVFAPAGGVAEGYQAVFRARTIWGPYEARVVLDQGATPVNGPHQGAWVDTPAGEHWFFHFQEMPAYGRVVHLQPLHWGADGWPVIGVDPDHEGKGQPALVHAKPALPVQPVAVPATSDDFSGGALGRQWQWQGNPQPGWADVATHPGTLRLPCTPAPDARSHWLTPHLLLQKFPAPTFTAQVRLAFHPAGDLDAAGLMVFGHDYAWLGLIQREGQLVLTLQVCRDAHRGGEEHTVATAAVALPTRPEAIELQVHVGPGASCQFAYRLAGLTFTPLGPLFAAKSSYWVGAKVGLFAASTPNSTAHGHADFASFVIGTAE